MTGRELAEALHDGRRVFGTMVSSPSPRFAGAARDAGLDFAFNDTEHPPLGRERGAWRCPACGGAGRAPLVRVPEPDPFLATMALDAGAQGVIFPYVESAEQAEALRGATKLRPLKGRRLARVLAGEERLEPDLADYLARRNAGSVMVVNVESVPAIEALDEILAVPGLDAVLIGPHDLSCSLGIPERYGDARFEQAVATIVGKARAADVGAGIHYWASLDQEIAWAKAGMNMLIHGIDAGLFAGALRRDLATLRAAVAEAPPAG